MNRRCFLLASVAGAITVPLIAKAQQAGGILKTPRALTRRHALVVGNNSYRYARLKNPINDARAIAEELRRVGFDVQVRFDATRDVMVGGIRDFAATLRESKGIGLFYYAGHGAQLDWRNHLLPVDTVIDKVEDLNPRGVELGTLLDALTNASNTMNILVLDACRDNPFGPDARLTHKGLSQFDAPRGSLIAYATAPGHVAQDGDGQNGLYTASLLTEMRVPGASIEDIFKRVRLSVRTKSAGQQSGYFSELAEFRLNRLLSFQSKGRIVDADLHPTPFSQGNARADTNFQLGDSYTYRVFDLRTGVQQRLGTSIVVRVSESEIFFSNGAVLDRLGNVLKDGEGREFSAAQTFASEYSVGKKWTTRYITIYRGTKQSRTQMEYRVTAKEQITVPAGTFGAYRVEGRGVAHEFGTQIRMVYWVDPPKVRRPIAVEIERVRSSRVITSERRELSAFTQR